MPRFCHQVRFTSAAWSRILQHPDDRFESLRIPIETLRGTLQAAFFAMDSFDVLAITDFPEGVSPSDISVACSVGGEIAQIHTTRLLDASQAVEAMQKASSSTSHPAPRARFLVSSSSSS
jgi:uncharacterized protein with GYD domain